MLWALCALLLSGCLPAETKVHQKAIDELTARVEALETASPTTQAPTGPSAKEWDGALARLEALEERLQGDLMVDGSVILGDGANLELSETSKVVNVDKTTSEPFFSLGATYCGTAPSIDGDIGGYHGAKLECEAGCKSSSAHMCTLEELVTTVAVGGVLPGPGVYWAAGVGSDTVDKTNRDCEGYTSSDVNVLGTVWDARSEQIPDTGTCNGKLPVACCD